MRLPHMLRVLGLVSVGALMLGNRCGGVGNSRGLNGDKIIEPSQQTGAAGARGANGNDNAVGMSTVTPTKTPRGPGYGPTDGTGGP